MHGVVICEICLEGNRYLARLDQPARLHIPLHFDQTDDEHEPALQPNHFEAPRARAKALKGDGFTADTRLGGSCNALTLELTPHCNGTHTESVGHLTHARCSVDELLLETLIPAAVISITPCPPAESEERARHALVNDDRLITAEALAKALAGVPTLPGLIVRTWPNDPDKRHRTYEGASPAPFFTLEAAAFARDRGVRHLLVDVPSLDRAHDEGHLGAHRAFWGMREGEHIPAPGREHCTITEMIYANDSVADGLYLLNLQIAPFNCDASPSRVFVYPLEMAR
ncbi:MAG: cyclase family protein [Pseudomonadota bacterium]